MKIYNVDGRDYFLMHTRKVYVLKKKSLSGYYLPKSVLVFSTSQCLSQSHRKTKERLYDAL